MTLDEARQALGRVAVAYSQGQSEPARLRALCEAAALYAETRLKAAFGVPAAAAAEAKAASRAAELPRAAACKGCGAPIVFAKFGNGKWAISEPDSFASGFGWHEGKPHFERTRGHRLHDCPARGGGEGG